MTRSVPLLEDLGDLEGKSVLVRLDLNVPLAEAPEGGRVVADDFRIRAALPTLFWLREPGLASPPARISAVPRARSTPSTTWHR